MRSLLIKAKGGLGNRMLAGVCGLVYADLAGRQAIVDWREGSYAPPGVNAYPLLFDTPVEATPDALADASAVTPSIWRGRLNDTVGDLIAEVGEAEHSNPRAYRKYCVALDRTDQPEEVAVFWSYLPKFRRLARALAADERFRGKSEEAIASDYLDRYFTPNARVRGAVRDKLAEIPRPVTGVHIRYTDRKIPLGKFWARIDAARAAAPDGGLYLATDNGEVEAEVRRRYGQVFTIEKWFPEDGGRIHDNTTAPDMTREAENALIDMYALAGVDQLVYSRHSTFSYASKLIGGLSDAQTDDVDRLNLKVRAKRLIQDYA